MNLLNDYSSIIVHSLLQLKEGDALSVNTEESDFEFAKIIADMAVRITKVVAKIVVTVDGKPSEVIDFDPYDMPVQVTSMCMLHLKHNSDDIVGDEKVLDIIVDKEDLRSIQKLGHLADPVIPDRRIVIAWCVVPAFYADDINLKILVDRLSNDIEGQILSAKYRKKYLNQTDISRFHLYSENCDFSVDFPNGAEFVGGPVKLANGREFLSGTDFQRLMCNVDKNGLNGWFICNVRVFGKIYKVKLRFDKGIMFIESDCKQFKNLVSFDDKLLKPGYISLNDNDFSIGFGCSLLDSLVSHPESVEDLPDWFNDSIYKYECVLDEKVNIEYCGSDKKYHELVRKGFFLD